MVKGSFADGGWVGVLGGVLGDVLVGVLSDWEWLRGGSWLYCQLNLDATN
jgi:hypothetical protein